MKSFQIEGIPAVLYGETSQKLYLFVHGKHGQKEDAEQFAAAACQKGYQVLSLDLPEHGARKKESGTFDPWHAVPELKRVISVARESWSHISLRANSIGAYFSMLGFANEAIERCLFVSPILDMKRLIANLMQWSGVTEAQLEKTATHHDGLRRNALLGISYLRVAKPDNKMGYSNVHPIRFGG
jgi:alpha-beta hydrolase superfamily lysophospholipase